MSTSETVVDFDLVDAPDETPDDTDTTYIVHRYTDANGNTVDKRMPMTDWPTYAKENGL